MPDLFGLDSCFAGYRYMPFACFSLLIDDPSFDLLRFDHGSRNNICQDKHLPPSSTNAVSKWSCAPQTINTNSSDLSTFLLRLYVVPLHSKICPPLDWLCYRQHLPDTGPAVRPKFLRGFSSKVRDHERIEILLIQIALFEGDQVDFFFY